MRGARHADHAGALEIHQRHVLDAGDALDRQARARRGADQRALLVSGEGVADPDGDVAPDRRRHGLRMDHLGAEVRQLHGLVVRQRVDHLRVRHAARIGRQHAVDVGPDVNLGGIQQRAEDRGGEVAAVAPERGLHAARIGGDEAGDDEAGRCRRWRRPCSSREQPFELRARSLPLHGRSERPPLHRDAAARVDPLHTLAHATLLEIAAEQPRRPDFAEAGRRDPTRSGRPSASGSWSAARPPGRRCPDRTPPGTQPPRVLPAVRRRCQHAARAPQPGAPASLNPAVPPTPPAAAARRSHPCRRTAPPQRAPAARASGSPPAATESRRWSRRARSSAHRPRSSRQTYALPTLRSW